MQLLWNSILFDYAVWYDVCLILSVICAVCHKKLFARAEEQPLGSVDCKFIQLKIYIIIYYTQKRINIFL